MSSDFTLFNGRAVVANPPTRLLRRFTKADRVAEIRERTGTSFKAIEFMVLVDGSLLESQMFHGRRLEEYAPALEVRANQLTDDGWLEQPVVHHPFAHECRLRMPTF